LVGPRFSIRNWQDWSNYGAWPALRRVLRCRRRPHAESYCSVVWEVPEVDLRPLPVQPAADPSSGAYCTAHAAW